VALCAGTLLLLSGCSGSGGRPPPGGASDGGNQSVTVSGTVTFQRITFNSGVGNGLNPGSPTTAPARGVVVEALSQVGQAVLDTTTTDATGAYTVTVPANTMIRVSVRAQMLKSDAPPTWDVQVRNNTNADALYTLESSAFDTGSNGATNRNLLAATGFSGGSYTGTRAAAPFAILDTIFAAQQLIVSADAAVAFPQLNVFWSDQNRTTGMQFCIDTGDLGTSFYVSEPGSDGCAAIVPAGIYLVGAFDGGSGDTDEFDQHVIAHEYGHYVEDKFSRSDSIGGEHGIGDLLDLRVAFGEGWGNAISAMVLNDPQYRDSFDGVDNDFGFNLENGADPSPGWYSESSTGGLIWDLFDDASGAEPTDTVAGGFTPIFAAMTGEQRTTQALTSVFSFLQGYGAVNPAAAAGVAQLRAALQISGTDAFGSGETNDGGDASVLPVYASVALNDAPRIVCTNAANGDRNRLGFRKFFVLQLAGDANVTVNVTGAVGNPGSAGATDPDIFIFRQGVEVARAETADPDDPSESLTQALTAGTYVIELFDFAALESSMPRCMNFAVTGMGS
jgi:hypothetical protein